MFILNTWLLIFLIHLVFSTTFITTLVIGILINARLRQYILICVTWCLWLLGSFLFSFGRVMLGLYHISRISMNITFFILSSLLLRFSLIIRSYLTAKDNLFYKLEQANSYEEWFNIGNKLDLISGGYEWRRIEETEDYQWMYLKDYVLRLKEARKTKNYKKLVFLLRWCCDRNFASISRQSLYNKAFSGTKILIDEFEEEIINVLKFLSNSSKNVDSSYELGLALSDKNTLKLGNIQNSRSGSIDKLISRSQKSIINSSKNSFEYIEDQNFDSDISSDLDSFQKFLNDTDIDTEEISNKNVSSFLNSDNKESTSNSFNELISNELKKDVSIQTCELCLNSEDIEYNGFIKRRLSSPAKLDYKNIGICDHNFDLIDNMRFNRKSNIAMEYSKFKIFRESSIKKDIKKMNTIDIESSNLTSSQSNDESIINNNLIHFLELLSHSIGKTALCLSGGGALAMYHLGVIKVLIEQNIMPKIISGTSGGSIVAAILATKTNDEILSEYVKPTVSNMHGHRWFPPFLDQIRHFLIKGYMINPKEFTKTCQIYFKNYTFYEAYKLTGRIVTITVSPTYISPEYTEPLVLNCITTPDILLWSAVVASCALPGLMPVAELFAKENQTNKIIRYFPPGMKWMDGSISQDIPHKELSMLFNVRQFIVSQVNPHHIPFVSINSINTTITHPERTFLYNILNWLTLDIKYRYTKLAKLKLIPKLFGKDVSNFWMLQEIEGHVTITPKVSLFDWYRCINHPSYDDMLHFISGGERRTWPHVMRIKHMNFLEKAIKECIQSIKHNQKKILL